MASNGCIELKQKIRSNQIKSNCFAASVSLVVSAKVTTVQNLEAYGIDVRQFAQMLQRKVAGSATVVPSEQKNRGPEVHVQGNQLDFITRTLLGEGVCVCV